MSEDFIIFTKLSFIIISHIISQNHCIIYKTNEYWQNSWMFFCQSTYFIGYLLGCWFADWVQQEAYPFHPRGSHHHMHRSSLSSQTCQQSEQWSHMPPCNITNTHTCCVRFEVFTTVTMKSTVFRDVTPCGSCKNRYFGGTYFFAACVDC
jgi:hypothetical protein